MQFLPRDAIMHKRGYAVMRCVCVCVSVTFVYDLPCDLPCAASLAGIQPVRPRAQQTSP